MKFLEIVFLIVIGFCSNLFSQNVFDFELPFRNDAEFKITACENGNIIANNKGHVYVFDSTGVLIKDKDFGYFQSSKITRINQTYLITMTYRMFDSGYSLLYFIDDNLEIVKTIEKKDEFLYYTLAREDGFIWYGETKIFKYSLEGDELWEANNPEKGDRIIELSKYDDENYVLATWTATDTVRIYELSESGVLLHKIDVRENTIFYGRGIYAIGNYASRKIALMGINNTEIIIYLYENYNKIVETKQEGYYSSTSKAYDGGFFITGHLGYRGMLFLKFDKNGTLDWRKTIVTEQEESAFQIEPLSGNKYVAIGAYQQNYNAAVENYWMLITDSLFTLPENPNFSKLPDYNFNTAFGKWLDINNTDSLYFLNNNYELFKLGDIVPSQNLKELCKFVSAGFPPAMVDIDLDGDNDLIINAYKDWKYSIMVLKNSQGTFTVDNTYIFDQNFYHTDALQWIDVNNDGYLDIFEHYGDRNKLYLFDGLNSYKEHKNSHITQVTDNVVSYAWVDIDNDNDLDLNVRKANSDKSILFKNDGKGTFTIDRSFAFENLGINTAGQVWEDFDNDGDLDVILMTGYNDIFHENRNGEYVSVNKVGLFGILSDYISVDYNNDGYMDLFQPDEYSVFGSIPLFQQNCVKGFSEKWYSNMRAEYIKNSQFQLHDFNNDGSIDVYIPREHPTASYPSNIFLADSIFNNWIKIRLIGRASNINGIGSKIVLKSNENRNQTIATHYVKGIENFSKVGFLNQLGVGSHESIDSIIIFWPSGCQQYLTNVNANQSITIVENCCGNSPQILNEDVCYRELFSYNTPENSKLKFYKTFNDETPFFTGTKFETDTISTSQIIYYSNADSVLESRKVPFRINAIQHIEAGYEFKLINNELSVTNMSANYDSLLWDFGDGTKSTMHSLTHVYQDTGKFQLTLNLKNQCFDIQIDTLLTIYIEDSVITHAEDQIKLYPNPAKQYLIIELPYTPVNNSIELSILSLQGGTEIFNQKLDNRINTINIEALINGVYIYRVSINNAIVKSTKFIIVN